MIIATFHKPYKRLAIHSMFNRSNMRQSYYLEVVSGGVSNNANWPERFNTFREARNYVLSYGWIEDQKD